MKIEQNNFGEGQTIINNESGVVNINQSGRYTDLANENTLHVYKEISHVEQSKFMSGFIIACLLPGLSLIADLMQIHPAIDFPMWIYVVTFSAIFIVVVVEFYDNFKIFSSIEPGDKECRQLYADRLFSKTEDGYIIFTHSSSCIYPDCEGRIVISSPPERYNGNYSFFGKCKLAGKQHSYGIDYNFKAYPIKVDWRPIPRDNK